MGRLGTLRIAALFLVALGVGVTSRAAPVAGQMNTFQGGTEGWGQGINTTNTVVTSGGPAGLQDNYIRVTAFGGGGPGSRLITLNESSPWTGNFLAAQIAAVEMDVRSFDTQSRPLYLRVALRSASGSAVVSAPHVMTADGTWHHVVFPLTSDALTPAGSFTSVMSNVADFRILHGVDSDHRGEPIASSFGLDNIRLVGIPEPSAALLAAWPILLLRRRRK
jgi:hypothetical protein